ncbi:hypothetical protein JCM8097_008796 [Rhodosporidiobolus ruineniae]
MSARASSSRPPSYHTVDRAPPTSSSPPSPANSTNDSDDDFHFRHPPSWRGPRTDEAPLEGDAAKFEQATVMARKVVWPAFFAVLVGGLGLSVWGVVKYWSDEVAAFRSLFLGTLVGWAVLVGIQYLMIRELSGTNRPHQPKYVLKLACAFGGWLGLFFVAMVATFAILNSNGAFSSSTSHKLAWALLILQLLLALLPSLAALAVYTVYYRHISPLRPQVRATEVLSRAEKRARRGSKRSQRSQASQVSRRSEKSARGSGRSRLSTRSSRANGKQGYNGVNAEDSASEGNNYRETEKGDELRGAAPTPEEAAAEQAKRPSSTKALYDSWARQPVQQSSSSVLSTRPPTSSSPRTPLSTSPHPSSAHPPHPPIPPSSIPPVLHPGSADIPVEFKSSPNAQGREYEWDPAHPDVRVGRPAPSSLGIGAATPVHSSASGPYPRPPSRPGTASTPHIFSPHGAAYSPSALRASAAQQAAAAASGSPAAQTYQAYHPSYGSSPFPPPAPPSLPSSHPLSTMSSSFARPPSNAGTTQTHQAYHPSYGSSPYSSSSSPPPPSGRPPTSPPPTSIRYSPPPRLSSTFSPYGPSPTSSPPPISSSSSPPLPPSAPYPPARKSSMRTPGVQTRPAVGGGASYALGRSGGRQHGSR